MRLLVRSLRRMNALWSEVNNVKAATTDTPKQYALSFSGCGFLGIYHFGSYACLRKHGLKVLSKIDKVAGCSVGGLVASMVVLNPGRYKEILALFYKVADEVNSQKLGALTPGFSLLLRVEELIAEILPDEAHEAANDKIFLSLTKWSDRSNIIVSKYPDRDTLIKCLVASCWLPGIYASLKESAPEIEGVQYGDGCISGNLPKFPDSDIRTITISPFSGEADISPQDDHGSIFDWTMTVGGQRMQANVRNVVRGAQALFPPSRETLEKYFDLGYRDTMKFLLNENLFDRDDGTEL